VSQLVSRLWIAAPFAAHSHGNPETKGHGEIQNPSTAGRKLAPVCSAFASELPAEKLY
jgi:hypothetical protein